MRRLVLASVVVAFLANVATCAAEEPSLEFLKGLRERGYHDLALEFLLKLRDQTDPPVNDTVKKVLPLEIARSQADVAAVESDSARREALVQQSQDAMRKFVTDPANAKHPALGDTYFDLARMLVSQARMRGATIAQLPPRDKAGRTKAAQEAAAIYDQANAALTEGNKLLEARWRELKDDPRDKAAREEKQRALETFLTSLLSQGVTLFEKAELLNEVDPAASGVAMADATKVFRRLADYRDRHALGWLGGAWLGRSYEGIQENLKEDTYKKVLNERPRPEVIPGQRAVYYFKLVTSFRQGASRAETRALAEKWLNDYAPTGNRGTPAVLASREGQHVRLMLATLYLNELEDQKRAQPKGPVNQVLVDRALAHLEALEKSGGEFAPQAKAEKFAVLRVSGRVTGKPVDDLRTFDECLLRAQLEMLETQDVAARLATAKDEDEKKELQETLNRHARSQLDAARRAVWLMHDQTKPDEEEQAKVLLYAAFYRLADYYRAAIAIEHLARSSKKPENARQYAAQALKLYQGLAANDRMEALARWIEARWPDDQACDVAREFLGNARAQEGKPKEALALWEKVSERSPTYAQVNFRAGAARWKLHQEAMRAAKKPFSTPSPDLDLAIAHFQKSIDGFAKSKDVDPKLPVYARVQLADVFATLGRHDEVLKLLNPLVEAFEKRQLPADLPAGLDTGILGLAMRSSVAMKDTERAMKLLTSLQLHAKDGELGSAMPELLRDLGRQVKTQMASLEQQGESAQEQLVAMKASLRDFLAKVEKTPNLPPDLLDWVGESYASLGEFRAAAEAFARIPEPADGAGARLYRASRLKRIAALRQEAVVHPDRGAKMRMLATAEKELAAVMENDWAKRHPEFIKEQVLLLQEQEKFGGPNGAIALWDRLTRSLEPILDRSPALRTLYDDAHFNLIYCRYAEAVRIKDASEKEKALRGVAQAIKPLRRNDYGSPENKARFERFIAQHPDLKAAVEKTQ